MRTIKKQNEHNEPSLETAVSLKKGDFNTPSVFQLFKKENGGLKYDVSNRLDTQIARSLLSNGSVFDAFSVKKKEPITMRISHRLSALRLCVWLFSSILLSFQQISIL